MHKDQEGPRVEFTPEEEAEWYAALNPPLPDWISISQIKLLSMKGHTYEQKLAEFGVSTLEGIPFAIDDSLGADPGFVLRYLDNNATS